uniref:Uncharacterized protein n=1 Tax=Fagus sylvatica TaxID=28930 RepID=A0A2N9F0Q7_FAGSY
MSEEAQRVLVIQDASRDVSSSAIRWTLQSLSLKPGDVVTLFGVLHQWDTRTRLISLQCLEANRKIVEDELAKKNEEYHNDEEIKKIAKQFETEKIEFHIKVHAGPCPKIVALTAAIKLRPTWVILDRMKRNNRILKLRGPKEIGSRKLLMESTVDQVTYNEMVPGSPDDEQSSSREDNATNTEQETAGERSPFSIAENQESSPKEEFHAGSPDEQQKEQGNKSDWTEWYEMEEEFDNYMCSICQNRRPKIGLQRDFTYAELQAATDGFPKRTIYQKVDLVLCTEEN